MIPDGRALLFDLDGCLVDSLPSIVRCWAETLGALGRPAPSMAEVRPFVGPPVDTIARALAPDMAEPELEQLVMSYRRCAAEAEDVAAFPGIPELLAALAGAGVPLGVATSKSIEVVEPLLERLELARCFEVVEGTRRDELGTDKATIVARALAGLAPLNAYALVGDRKHDVIGAHAHGLTAIGALWGYGSREELTAAGADVLVETPAELEALTRAGR
ncbi:MAG: HAD hydrolase-like protein [Solirubrobacteraceae bacterium]